MRRVVAVLGVLVLVGVGFAVGRGQVDLERVRADAHEVGRQEGFDAGYTSGVEAAEADMATDDTPPVGEPDLSGERRAAELEGFSKGYRAGFDDGTNRREFCHSCGLEEMRATTR